MVCVCHLLIMGQQACTLVVPVGRILWAKCYDLPCIIDFSINYRPRPLPLPFPTPLFGLGPGFAPGHFPLCPPVFAPLPAGPVPSRLGISILLSYAAVVYLIRRLPRCRPFWVRLLRPHRYRWLLSKDSNLSYQNQSLGCYHYTTEHS